MTAGTYRLNGSFAEENTTNEQRVTKFSQLQIDNNVEADVNNDEDMLSINKQLRDNSSPGHSMMEESNHHQELLSPSPDCCSTSSSLASLQDDDNETNNNNNNTRQTFVRGHLHRRSSSNRARNSRRSSQRRASRRHLAGARPQRQVRFQPIPKTIDISFVESPPSPSSPNSTSYVRQLKRVRQKVFVGAQPLARKFGAQLGQLRGLARLRKSTSSHQLTAKTPREHKKGEYCFETARSVAASGGLNNDDDQSARLHHLHHHEQQQQLQQQQQQVQRDNEQHDFGWGSDFDEQSLSSASAAVELVEPTSAEGKYSLHSSSSSDHDAGSEHSDHSTQLSSGYMSSGSSSAAGASGPGEPAPCSSPTQTEEATERRHRFLQNRLIINSKLESMFMAARSSASSATPTTTTTTTNPAGGAPRLKISVSATTPKTAATETVVALDRSKTTSQIDTNDSVMSRVQLLEQQRQISIQLNQKPRIKRQVTTATAAPNKTIQGGYNKNDGAQLARQEETGQQPQHPQLQVHVRPAQSLRQLVKEVIDDFESPKFLISRSDSLSSDIDDHQTAARADSPPAYLVASDTTTATNNNNNNNNNNDQEPQYHLGAPDPTSLRPILPHLPIPLRPNSLQFGFGPQLGSVHHQSTPTISPIEQSFVSDGSTIEGLEYTPTPVNDEPQPEQPKQASKMGAYLKTLRFRFATLANRKRDNKPHVATCFRSESLRSKVWSARCSSMNGLPTNWDGFT